MATVGEIIERVSELRSDKAIITQLMVYLQAHYMSSDAGAAEMKITRYDSAFVSEAHIERFLLKLEELAVETEAMQSEYEGFLASDPEEMIRARLRGGKDDAAQSEGGDRATAQDGEPDGGGSSPPGGTNEIQ